MSDGNNRRDDRPMVSRKASVKRARSTTGLVDVPAPSTKRRYADDETEGIERESSFESNTTSNLSLSAIRLRKGKGRAKAKQPAVLLQAKDPSVRLRKRLASSHDNDDDNDDGNENAADYMPALKRRMVDVEGRQLVSTSVPSTSTSSGCALVGTQHPPPTAGHHEVSLHVASNQSGSGSAPGPRKVRAITRRVVHNSAVSADENTSGGSMRREVEHSGGGVSQKSKQISPLGQMSNSNQWESPSHLLEAQVGSTGTEGASTLGHHGNTPVPSNENSGGSVASQGHVHRSDMLSSTEGLSTELNDEAPPTSTVVSVVQPTANSMQTRAQESTHSTPSQDTHPVIRCRSGRQRPGGGSSSSVPSHSSRGFPQRRVHYNTQPEFPLGGSQSLTHLHGSIPQLLTIPPPPSPPSSPPPPHLMEPHLQVSSRSPMFAPPTPHPQPILWVNTTLVPPPVVPGLYYTHRAQAPPPLSHQDTGLTQRVSSHQPHNSHSQGPSVHQSHTHHGEPSHSPHSGPSHSPHSGPSHTHHSGPSHSPTVDLIISLKECYLTKSRSHWSTGSTHSLAGQRDIVVFDHAHEATPHSTEATYHLHQSGNPMLWSDDTPSSSSDLSSVRFEGRGRSSRDGRRQDSRGQRWTTEEVGRSSRSEPLSEGTTRHVDQGRTSSVTPPVPERKVQIQEHPTERSSLRETGQHIAGTTPSGETSVSIPLYLTGDNHLPHIPLLHVVSTDHTYSLQSDHTPQERSTLNRNDGPSTSTAHHTEPTADRPSESSTARSSGPGQQSAHGTSHSNVEVIIVEDSSDEEPPVSQRRHRARRRQNRRGHNRAHPPLDDDDVHLHLLANSYLATQVSQWAHDGIRQVVHSPSSATPLAVSSTAATRPHNPEEWLGTSATVAPEVFYRVIIGPYMSVPAGVLSGGGSYEELIELAERLGPGGPQGIAKEVIDTIPVRTYSKAASNATSGGCVVCMNDFEDKDQVRSLPCSHEFHQHCIDQWLENHRSCPLCRGEVQVQ